MAKKYVSLNTLQTFLNNLNSLFATKSEMNAKSDKTHAHAITDITNLQSTFDTFNSTLNNYYTKTQIDDICGELQHSDEVVRYTEQTLTEEQKAQARENIGAAAVGEGGGGVSVQADLSQNDSTAADYVKNRTHWVKDSVITMEVCLKEGAYTFSDGYCDTVAIIPDLVPNANYIVTWDGVSYDVVSYSFCVEGIECIALGNPMLIGFEENPEDNGQPFAGFFAPSMMITNLISIDIEATEHTVSIAKKIVSEEIHKLDDKYIDASWMAKNQLVSVTAFSEATAEVSPDGVTNPDWVYDVEALKSAAYFNVVWNGENYRCYPKSFVGMLLIGNLFMFNQELCVDSGEPFLFMLEGTAMTIVALEEMQATFNITAYHYVPASTMPIEYLPEQLRFGHEYKEETLKEVITWDGDITDRELCDFLNVPTYHVSTATPDGTQLMNGGYIAFNDGTTIPFDASGIQNIENWVFYLGSYVLVLTETAAPLLGVSSGIYFLKQGALYVTEFSINNYTFVDTETKIKTIDPMYLPENIGGSGLPEVTADDNGKSLSVVDGEWQVGELSYNDLTNKPTLFSGSYNDLTNKPIPAASASSEGAFLRVVNGAWNAVVLPNAEDGEF